jgi:hypothetical protein
METSQAQQDDQDGMIEDGSGTALTLAIVTVPGLLLKVSTGSTSRWSTSRTIASAGGVWHSWR